MSEKRIHPAFKNFILTNAVDKWDKILKDQYGQECGIDSGVCFQTSNAFCKILDKNFGIPCNIEPVQTLVGNSVARNSFAEHVNSGKTTEEFMTSVEKIIKEKGKENLTEKDPVLIGMGFGDNPDQFHFIMKLEKQSEIMDLTLARIKRPKWGIDCKNYWTKYEKDLIKNDLFYSSNVWHMSGCVMYTEIKKTPIRVSVYPEKYKAGERMLENYILDEVKKRSIPVFLGR